MDQIMPNIHLNASDCVPSEFRNCQRFFPDFYGRLQLSRVALREHVWLVGHTATRSDMMEATLDLYEGMYGNEITMDN